MFSSFATITNIQDISNLDIDMNSENTLRSALDSLRTLFPNALITTFTYDPLIGITSITDTKGDRISFTYDTDGRLKNTIDKTGNILSENQYNYKP